MRLLESYVRTVLSEGFDDVIDVIRVEGIVARVTPIFSGTASIMGVKISGRTDDIKHIYRQYMIVSL